MNYSVRQLMILSACIIASESGSQVESSDFGELPGLPIPTSQRCILQKTDEGFVLVYPATHQEIGFIRASYDSDEKKLHVERIDNHTINPEKQELTPVRGVGTALMAAYLMSAHIARERGQAYPDCEGVYLLPCPEEYGPLSEKSTLVTWYSTFGFKDTDDVYGHMEFPIAELAKNAAMFYIKHGPGGRGNPLFLLVDGRAGKKHKELCVVPQSLVGDLGGVDRRRCPCPDCHDFRRRLGYNALHL